MKYHILFSRKNSKNIVSLSSAESAHSVISVNIYSYGICWAYMFKGAFSHVKAQNH